MKIERYHTIGARRNPADIVIIESSNRRESMAIVPEEMAKVHDATGIELVGNPMDDGMFSKLRFHVNSVKKSVYQLERNTVKHWATEACREAWNKEDVDSVETASTLQVINALTGDIVELLAEGNNLEREDVILGVEEDEAEWAKALADCGDDTLTLLPDQFELFFAECDGLGLEDLNVQAETEAIKRGQDILDVLAKLNGHGMKITSTDKLQRAVARLVRAEVAL